MKNPNKIALALFTCIVMFGAFSATASASDFPQFQNDTNHSGITHDPAPTTAPTLAWSPKVGSGWVGFDSAPVVGGDKVFAVYQNGSVFAFNKTTGEIVWQNKTIGGGSFELATPAYHDGVLYVALSRGNASTSTSIYALWANNGTIKWGNTAISNQQTNTPVVYDNDRVYFGTVNVSGLYTSDKGTYYCYNATNGSKVWERNTTTDGGYYWAGAAVIGDYLVYGDDNGTLVSVSKNNITADTLNVSTLNNNSTISGPIRSSVAYKPGKSMTTGRIYFTSKGTGSGGYCYAIGYFANNGTFNRSDNWNTSLGAESTSTPAVYNGKVYVGQSPDANGYGFRVLDESDGSIYNSYKTNCQVQASPVLSVNQSTGACYVYFTTNIGTDYGYIHCVDGDGNFVWSYRPPGYTYTLQGVAISDGYVYFGNDNSYMYGLH